MIYKVTYIEINGSTETAIFSTKKSTQAFLNRNDIPVESIVKNTQKGETDVTHLFDIQYFSDSAEQEQEYLDKLDEESQLEEVNQPEEYFLGRKYYKNKGFFFNEKELEKLLWKVLELIKGYPEKIDYERMIDEILKMDKKLNLVNRSPFSETDKRIFNTEILLSRLKGLVTFEMWKQEHPHFN